MNGAAGTFALFLAVAWEQHGREIVTGAAVLVALGVIWRYLILPPVRLFKRLDKAVTAVETQLLTNNGGSTVLDKIDAIDERTKALEQWRMKQEGEV